MPILGDYILPLETVDRDRDGSAIPGNCSTSLALCFFYISCLNVSYSTQFAELLGDMYHETVHAVNERGSELYAIFLLLTSHNLSLPRLSIPTDLSTETRFRLIESLDSWKFEPHKLPEEELLACTLILFEGLYRIEGIEDAVGVSLSTYHLSVIHSAYVSEVTRANFGLCASPPADLQTRKLLPQFRACS